jgi:hypothetical protein
MTLLKLVLVAAIAGGTFSVLHSQARRHEARLAAEAVQAGSGFVAMPPMTNHAGDAVLVVAAENCPHEDAQRADRLADQLRESGVPVVRSQQVSFSPAGVDRATLERMNSVMTGPLPVVFVHGRAKGNPSATQVLAEWGRAAP